MAHAHFNSPCQVRWVYIQQIVRLGDGKAYCVYLQWTRSHACVWILCLRYVQVLADAREPTRREYSAQHQRENADAHIAVPVRVEVSDALQDIFVELS